MKERQQSLERTSYTPVYAPLRADYAAVMGGNEDDGLRDSVVTQFHELPHPTLKRQFVRTVIADIASDTDVSATTTPDKTKTDISLTPNPARQQAAFELFKQLEESGELPEATQYDTYWFLGQWNRAQLIGADRAQSAAFLRYIAPTQLTSDTDAPVADAIAEEPTDPNSYLLFSLSEFNDADPESRVSVASIDHVRDGKGPGMKNISLLAERTALLTTNNVDVRRSVSTGADTRLSHTTRVFREYIRPFTGFSTLNELPPPIELYNLIADGYNGAQLEAEFGMSPGTISRLLKNRSLDISSIQRELPPAEPLLIEDPGKAQEPPGIKRPWSHYDAIREHGYNIKFRTPPAEIAPVIDHALEIARELRHEYADWVHEQVQRALTYFANRPVHSAREREVHSESEIEEAYENGLRRSILLLHKARQKRIAAGEKLDHRYTATEIRDTTVGFTLNFFSMLRQCEKKDIPSGSSLTLAERSYRYDPAILDRMKSRFDHLPYPIIAHAITRSITNMEDFLTDLNERTQRFRAMPQYQRISTTQIANALFGKTDEYATRALNRYKDIPKKEQAKRDAERRRIAGTGRRKRTRIRRPRPPTPPAEPFELLETFVPQLKDLPPFETSIPSIPEHVLYDTIEPYRPEERTILAHYIREVHRGRAEPDVIDEIAQGDAMMASRVRGLARRLNRTIDKE